MLGVYIYDQKLPIIKYICIKCGKVFLDYKNSNRKFCSRKCANISIHLGRHRSKETKEKMSKTRSTPEMVEQQSKIMKERWVNGEFNGVVSNISKEIKEKRIEGIKRAWREGKYDKRDYSNIGKGMKKVWSDPNRKKEIIEKMKKFQNKPEVKENHRKGVKKAWSEGKYDNAFTSPTTLEVKLYNFLDSKNIPYKKQYKINIGYKTKYIDAFIFPNVCIEADGEFWHSDNVFGDNRKKEDKKDNESLRKFGYIIYRILGIDFKNKKYIEILNVILTRYQLNQKS